MTGSGKSESPEPGLYSTNSTAATAVCAEELARGSATGLHIAFQNLSIVFRKPIQATFEIKCFFQDASVADVE